MEEMPPVKQEKDKVGFRLFAQLKAIGKEMSRHE